MRYFNLDNQIYYYLAQTVIYTSDAKKKKCFNANEFINYIFIKYPEY